MKNISVGSSYSYDIFILHINTYFTTFGTLSRVIICGSLSIFQRLSMESAIERKCWVVARRATFVFIAIIFLAYLAI